MKDSKLQIVVDWVLHPLSAHKRWLRAHSRYCEWIQRRNSEWPKNIHT